jgi:hypothetical protein
VAWEIEQARIGQERLGRELEAALVIAGVIEPARQAASVGHAEVVLMDNPPDLSRPSDFPSHAPLEEVPEWLSHEPVQIHPDESPGEHAIQDNELGLDFDDF